MDDIVILNFDYIIEYEKICRKCLKLNMANSETCGIFFIWFSKAIVQFDVVWR